jgi:Rrf2 family protein
MLALSQTTGYAILALSCLGSPGERVVQAAQIARCTRIPGPYLSKILHALARSGLIRAKRGRGGGFTLARLAAQISLLDVAEAVEGESWAPCCLLGLAGCSQERACPTHRFWTVQRARIEAELRRVTLCEVARFERRLGIRMRYEQCAPGVPNRATRRAAACRLPARRR